MTLKPWEVAPAEYEALLEAKVERVRASLAHFDPPAPRVYPSPPTGYRGRAEFRIWHDGDDLFYAMFDPEAPREPVRVDSFPAALPSIQRRMAPLREALCESPVLRRKLFQCEFMGTQDDEVLVTLAYHRRLDEDWLGEAADLAAREKLLIVGRSRKQKEVIGADYVRESFRVAGREYRYRQYEQSFAQPNTIVNASMLAWASGVAEALDGDLLELYCGNGNFTLPLARHFRRVVATELSKSGTRAARENLGENAIDNVDIVRLSAEEVSQALSGQRTFRRLAALPQPLAEYALNTVFVDPPRAGLDEAALASVQAFAQIIYVSCNPATLRENLDRLHTTHRIASLAFFDQFPYTGHLECGVMLQRR